jgi:NCAIR mutase (PurE)-related protein
VPAAPPAKNDTKPVQQPSKDVAATSKPATAPTTQKSTLSSTSSSNSATSQQVKDQAKQEWKKAAKRFDNNNDGRISFNEVLLAFAKEKGIYIDQISKKDKTDLRTQFD